jgi:hypothetical protein
MSNVRYLGDGPSGTKVLAASPLVKQPGTIAYRVVLLEYPDEDKYSVHRQGWTNGLPKDPSNPKGSHLGSGDYFHWHAGMEAKSQGEALEKALTRFAERVALEAGYMQSVYRDAS